MAKKIMPVFRFTEGSKAEVTLYTTQEYKELLRKEKEAKLKKKEVNHYPSKEYQIEKYSELVTLLRKEGTTKTNDFMGVEDDIQYKEYVEGEDYYTMCNTLFFNILTELESMSDHGHEFVCDEYDDDQPFRTEHNVKQYVGRLAKFVIKYAPKYLETEEEVNYYINEAKAYL